jgi:hypothetical protein
MQVRKVDLHEIVGEPGVSIQMEDEGSTPHEKSGPKVDPLKVEHVSEEAYLKMLGIQGLIRDVYN